MAIYHLALPQDWEQATRAGSYEVSTRGRTLAEEGFIHLSEPDQWPLVRRRFYADVPGPLLLLTVDEARLGGEVRREPPAPGVQELYPHLYGPLPLDAVTEVRELLAPHG